MIKAAPSKTTAPAMIPINTIELFMNLASLPPLVTRRFHPTNDLAVFNSGLLEGKDVLHDDDITLHPLDLGHIGDFSGSVLEAVLLNDQVDRRRDLFADGAHGKVHPGHQTHRLQTRERVARSIGVSGRHRAIVTGVHRLEHVERFATAALSNDNPLRTHSERVDNEIADRDFAFAFDIGRTRLKPDDVILP
jgi:hypothetical protein